MARAMSPMISPKIRKPMMLIRSPEKLSAGQHAHSGCARACPTGRREGAGVAAGLLDADGVAQTSDGEGPRAARRAEHPTADDVGGIVDAQVDARETDDCGECERE